MHLRERFVGWAVGRGGQRMLRIDVGWKGALRTSEGLRRTIGLRSLAGVRRKILKWKLLAGLDKAFSSLAVLAAVALGNSLLAMRVPELHRNATWLSKLVMGALTAPDAIADWALAFAPGETLLFLVLAFLAGESSLILFSPLVLAMLALLASQEFKLGFPEAYARMSHQRGRLWPFKRHLLKRVLRRLLPLCLLGFGMGLVSAAIAWGVATLINLNSTGLLQTIAVTVGVAVLLMAAAAGSEVLPAAVEDEKGDELLEQLIQLAK